MRQARTYSTKIQRTLGRFRRGMASGAMDPNPSLSKTVLANPNRIRVCSRQMSSNPFFTQIRGFATEAGAKASEAPRGPLGNIFSFLPRWGSPYVFCIAGTVVVSGKSWASILFSSSS